MPGVHKSLGSIPAPHKPSVGYTPVTLVLRRRRLKFKITLGYTGVEGGGGVVSTGLRIKSKVFSILDRLQLLSMLLVCLLPPSYSLQSQSSCWKHVCLCLRSPLSSPSAGLCLRRHCWRQGQLWALPPIHVLMVSIFIQTQQSKVAESPAALSLLQPVKIQGSPSSHSRLETRAPLPLPSCLFNVVPSKI